MRDSTDFSPLQKCLDKDPAKRWSCDRLLTHSYFEDYAKRHKELEASLSATQGSSAGDLKMLNREKTKVSEFCSIL